MKIKDIIDMRGKFSAYDVGECEVEMNEDLILSILIEQNFGFTEDYLCGLAEEIAGDEAIIRQCGPTLQGDKE